MKMDKSESIKNIAISLSKAQAGFGKVSKSSEGYNYNYADLAECMNNVMPALTENGLSLVQFPLSEENKIGVETILMHNSGEFISSKFLTDVKDKDPQSIGKVITYYRRYSLMACCGLAPEDDECASLREKIPSSNVGTSNFKPSPKAKTNQQPQAINQQPQGNGGEVMPFGKTKGQTFDSLGAASIISSREWCISKNDKGQFTDLIKKFDTWLANQ